MQACIPQKYPYSGPRWRLITSENPGPRSLTKFTEIRAFPATAHAELENKWANLFRTSTWLSPEPFAL